MISDSSAPVGVVGGKAAGLYRLQRLGAAVPPFLVVPAETFDAVLHGLPTDETGLDQRRQRLLAFALSGSDQAAIARQLGDWSFPQRAVVVRSSVADEDGEQNAFPGLMDSFLNLTSLDDVVSAVTRCAASAYSDRAIAYRRQRGLTPAARPAVIIQQQVTPTASGVLFTTFPDYPQEMAVHALFGFGEGLMTGGLDTDEFYWLKQTGALHRTHVVTKTEQVIAATTGLMTAPVSPDQQQRSSLSPDQLAELFRLGTLLEQHLGHPQDVEFVATADRVFVVQARPITQPIPEVVVYDNANIQESYCGVTTPLTFSFASRAYATVYRQTMQTLGLPKAAIQAHEPIVTNLLGLVQGRIYYHINNWYRGLQLLPSFRQNKADMERMMGLDEPVDFVSDTEKTLSQKLAMLPRLLINLSRLLGAFFTLPQRIHTFQTHFRQQYERFYALDLSNLSRPALLAEKTTLDTQLLGNWATPIINDFYVMMTNGQVGRLLAKAGMEQPDEFLSRYLSGDKQIESTQPVRTMQQLAGRVNAHAPLRELILMAPVTLHEQMITRFPAFAASVEAFIGQYGDRTVGELKLETITMRLEPALFYRYLRNYLLAERLPTPLTDTTHLHTAAAAELTQRLSRRSPLFRWRVWRALSRLQQAIRSREALRLERTRLFGMYRSLYRTMGDQLVRSGSLATQDDVFFLTETELTVALTAPTPPDLNPLVATRRTQFAQYETEDVPGRVVVPSPPTQSPQPSTVFEGQLRGTGCVPGAVTGEVIVITDPRDSLDVTDKIVCALRTDPGWAVLFPTCRAVLIERGSSLSHSVILLRELGLPTIINVPSLTKHLQTGQTVTIDGRAGTIHLHDVCP